MNGVIVNTCLVKPLVNQPLIFTSFHQCQLLLVLNRTKIGNDLPGRQTIEEMPCHPVGISLQPSGKELACRAAVGISAFVHKKAFRVWSLRSLHAYCCRICVNRNPRNPVAALKLSLWLLKAADEWGWIMLHDTSIILPLCIPGEENQ